MKLLASAALAAVPTGAGAHWRHYGGYGYSYGYPGYGYGYGGYGYGGYPYGGYDPFGWYGDYYYPGSGVYVYDRSRTRRVWTDEQRRYWENRRNRWQSRNGTSTNTGENWSGWDRSHWRDRNNSTSTTSPTPRTWTRDTVNHGNWQTHSSVTTSGERERSSDGGHHSREHAAERPN